jgi:hypothetical protein
VPAPSKGEESPAIRWLRLGNGEKPPPSAVRPLTSDAIESVRQTRFGEKRGTIPLSYSRVMSQLPIPSDKEITNSPAAKIALE